MAQSDNKSSRTGRKRTSGGTSRGLTKFRKLRPTEDEEHDIDVLEYWMNAPESELRQFDLPDDPVKRRRG
jgi:hypothetical protein